LDDGEEPKSSPIGLLTYEEYQPGWWTTLSAALGSPPALKPNAWVIILKLDLDKLYNYKISVEDIAIKIEEEATGSRGQMMACVASPNNVAEIEIYLNFDDVSAYSEQKVTLPDEERSLVNNENINYFVTREVALDLIKKTEVQGISGVAKSFVRKDNKLGEWVIDTQGTNLLDILCTPGVDSTRTLSDDMWEIYRVFGIEATRTFLIREMTKILSFDGNFINPRHITLLIDSMCRTGVITSVNRDGISRDVGPLAKGMFEKAVDNFVESALFTEHDDMKGVSGAIMFGTVVKAGTGTVEIKDAERLPAARPALKIPMKPTSECEKRSRGISKK